MYLQIETAQARGIFRAAVTLLIIGCAMAARGQHAEAAEPVAHHDLINAASINVEGSPALGEVNFNGSMRAAAVNQLDSSTDAALPNDPSVLLQELPLHAAKVDDEGDAMAPSRAPHIAPIHTKFIPAGWVAQPLTPHDKVIIGVKNLYSPFSVIGYAMSAGYSHLVNGQPNYGTNSTAFTKRLGAAVVRDTTEGAFTDMVFAPLLHEDPRYYVEGRRHGYVHRVLYAMTRPLITRTDSGHETLNGALLIGQASASALSYTYYPQINRNFHDTAATFGGSLAGSAIDDVISEFSGQFLKELHLRKSASMPR